MSLENYNEKKMRKQLGILSMHRVVNYGSFLQAYALKKMISDLCECDVYFIDIKKGYSLYKNPDVRSKRIIRILKFIFTGNIIIKIQRRNFNKRLDKQFKKRFYKLLGNIVDSDSKLFDYVIIGSDEVFHCCQNTPWGFTTQLYGDIPNAKKIFSYAASFGATNIEDINKFNLSEKIAVNLRKLNSISVRDENSENIVKELTGITPECNLDPVLIYGYKDEIRHINRTRCDNYMVVYSYNGRINTKGEIKAIRSFAKINKLKLYTVFCKYEWADKCLLPETPFEVLDIFENAQFTVSDTFHGTIFSIITHKKFATLMRDSATNKITSMLEKLGLEKHIVNEGNSLEDILSRDINYKHVECILNLEREKAFLYLKKNLI